MGNGVGGMNTGEKAVAKVLVVLGVAAAMLGTGLTALGSPNALVSPGHPGGNPPVLTASELVSDVRVYDRQRVTLKGEVVGSLLPRGEFTWVNVGDGSTAVGVWVPASLAARISVTGGYAARGDLVEVTGVFSAACPVHGGDADLHAEVLTVLERGVRRSPGVSSWRWGTAAGLLLAAGVASWLVARRR